MRGSHPGLVNSFLTHKSNTFCGPKLAKCISGFTPHGNLCKKAWLAYAEKFVSSSSSTHRSHIHFTDLGWTYSIIHTKQDYKKPHCQMSVRCSGYLFLTVTALSFCTASLVPLDAWRWPGMAAPGQLEPQEFVQVINQGQKLPRINPSGSTWVGTVIQDDRGFYHPWQLCWWYW